MDAAAMTRLLASANGDDPVALRRDLRAALGAALDEEEMGERVREAVGCLRSPSARLAATARRLLAATAETAAEVEGERLTSGEWLVLDALMTHVLDTLVAIASGNMTDRTSDEEPEEDEDVLWEVLVAFARRSTEELGRGSRERRWMQWCERSLHAVFAVQEEDDREGEGATMSSEQTKKRQHVKGRTMAIRAVARALLSLHKTLTESGDGRAIDIKLATLVWKNMTKLAKAHADVLFEGEPITESKHLKEETNTRENVGAPLDAEDVMSCVVSAMEDIVCELIGSLQLATAGDGPRNGCGHERNGANAAVGAALKVLRLYWRAFQGHFLHLAAALSSSSLENCVLATVNTASALMYVTVILPSIEGGHAHRLPPKVARDAHSLLELAMSFPAKITSAHEAPSPSLPETGLAIIQALMWYPAEDMVRAIVERQEQSKSEAQESDHSAKTARGESAMDAAIRWTHWRLLVAITAARQPDAVHDGSAAAVSSMDNDANIVEQLDKLFDRYRDDCAIRSSAAMVTRVTPFAIDALLELVGRTADFEQLQLALLKHAVHPSVDQRHLCWELWKELICYCWEEDTALAALETLLTLAEQESEDGDSGHTTEDHRQPPTPLSSRVIDKITRLVVFMYSEMPLSLKETCMQRVTSAIEHICSDGPYHAFSSIIAARLSLLDQLSTARFLRDYDHPDKEQWIAVQLPMCFECCGTIIELLNGTSAEPDLRTDAVKFAGAMRVLDVCLLVLRSVYDDNDAREDTTDLAELSRILLPVMTEVLTLLAKNVRRPPSVGGAGTGVRNGRARQHSESMRIVAAKSTELSTTRVLRTCLYLLSKMGGLLKRNHSNQCVQAMKNLLDLAGNDAAAGGEWELSTAGAIAWFVKTTLHDVQAAESDVPVVAELLTALFQRLCASEKASMESPLGLVILEALYGILANSNIARSLNIQASIPVASARRDLRQLALLHRDFNADVDLLTSAVVALVSSPNARKARATYAAHCHRVFRQWFPSSTDEAMEKAHEGSSLSIGDQKISPATIERKRRVDEQDNEPPTTTTTSNKRQKLAHLVARCRQVIDNCGSTAENVSDQELDRAATVLEDILAKVLSF